MIPQANPEIPNRTKALSEKFGEIMAHIAKPIIVPTMGNPITPIQ